jgi:hypothetical protein
LNPRRQSRLVYSQILLATQAPTNDDRLSGLSRHTPGQARPGVLPGNVPGDNRGIFHELDCWFMAPMSQSADVRLPTTYALLPAETEGFEPSVEIAPYGSFPSYYLRPLGHVSMFYYSHFLSSFTV